MGQVEVICSQTLLLLTSENLVRDVMINDRLGCKNCRAQDPEGGKEGKQQNTGLEF